MENIGNALAIASAIGVSETDLFQNAPLYDEHKSYHQGREHYQDEHSCYTDLC